MEKHYQKIIAFAFFAIMLFLIFQNFGPIKKGLLVGPAGVSPNFQNGTFPSPPDIVLTNITIPSPVKAGVANTVTVDVNVTTINTTGPAPGWNVNVTLYSASAIDSPNISRWASNNATTQDDVSAIAVGDVDDDGDNDVVAGIGATGDRLSLYVNPGNLNLNTWTVSNATTVDDAAAVAIADMDGDGDNDIIVGIGGGAGTARVSLYNNTAPGTINLGQFPVSNSTAKDVVSSLATGDLDKDGDNDLVVGISSAGNQISVYNNTGIINISLWPINNASEAASVTGVATADLDGNGKMDVIASVSGAVNRVSAYYGDGTTNILNWGAPSVFSLGGTTGRAVAVGDLDGDGDNDIVAGTGTGLTILNNTGGATPNIALLPTDTVTITDVIATIVIRDVNSDGLNDVVVGTFPGTKRVSIYANPGRDLKVSTWQSFNATTEDGVNAVALGDMDLDGDYDVVAGIGTTGDRVSLYQNKNTSLSVIGYDTGNFANVTNSRQIYSFSWTPSITASGAFNISAVADLAGNFSESDESNNMIVAAATINCVSLQGINSYTVTNNTTFCTGSYQMNSTGINSAAINVTNSSLTLDCNGATIYGVQSGGVAGVVDLGIFVNSSNVTIQGCNIANYTYGLLGNLSYNVNLTNNTFFNSTYGIFLNSTNLTAISNQTLRHNVLAGLSTLNSNNTTVLNSTIYNNSAHGIRIIQGLNISITNNTIYNNSESGIALEYANNTSILDNTISYGTHATNSVGIYGNLSANLSIKRNSISKMNALGGIVITGAASSCGWNLVQNNTLFNSTGVGITFVGCPNSTAANNTIYYNTRGISIKNNNYAIVLINNLIFNNTLGININDDNNVTIINNTIIDNNVSSFASANNRTGIRIFQSQWVNSSSINITGNNISGQDYGIYINETPFAYNVTIYNNYISNSFRNVVDSSGGNNTWNISKRAGTNIIGGAFIAGNFWSNYAGVDAGGDTIGDTQLPYSASGNITVGGDYAPLTTNTDTSAPANITALAETVRSDSAITWGWTNPGDADFDHVEVYLNQTFKSNTSSNSYQAIGLGSSTGYELEVRPVDTVGNIGNWTNDSATTTAAAAAGQGGGAAGGGGGGGGGGGAAAFENIPVGKVESGSTITLPFSKPEELYVEEVSLTTQTEVRNGYVQAARLEGKPATVSDPTSAGILAVGGSSNLGTGSGNLSNQTVSCISKKAIFSYLKLDPTNFKSSDLKKAEIKFLVNKDWLKQNDFSDSDIYLLRYTNSWQKLSTQKVGSTQDFHVYKAATPGFSFFAIYAEKASTDISCKTKPILSAKDGSSQLPEEVSQAEQKETAQVYKLSLYAVLVLIVVAVGFIFWTRSHKK